MDDDLCRLLLRGPGLANFIAYANCNAASRQFIDPAVLNDRAIYPDGEMMARLYTISAHDQKAQRLMNRLWTRVKTGL